MGRGRLWAGDHDLQHLRALFLQLVNTQAKDVEAGTFAVQDLERLKNIRHARFVEVAAAPPPRLASPSLESPFVCACALLARIVP
jgi:hypothetical protein